MAERVLPEAAVPVEPAKEELQELAELVGSVVVLQEPVGPVAALEEPVEVALQGLAEPAVELEVLLVVEPAVAGPSAAEQLAAA